MLGWIKQAKLQSRWPGDKSITRYAVDTTPMAESEKELKSFLIKVNEENEKAGLKLNTQQIKIMAVIWPHHFMANRWGNSRNSDRLYFLGLQNHCRW